MTVPVDVRNPEHAVERMRQAIVEAGSELGYEVSSRGAQTLAITLQHYLENCELSNHQLADRLVEDVWAEMPTADVATDLVFEAIGRLKDTWSREQMVGAR